MIRKSLLRLQHPTKVQHVHFPAITTPMLPAGSYDGKTCLVTGGGTGLGFAMASRFAELGANVVIASRQVNVLKEASELINNKVGSEKAKYIKLDIKDTKNVIDIFDQMEVVPDVVVNNAAGNFISPTERLSHNAFHNIIDIVLKGSASVTLEAGKRMIKEGKAGNFLAITVPYADTGSAYVVPSACAKSGVEALTKSLAAEWGRKGIRLNCIAPGPIYTEGAFGRLDPDGNEISNMLEKVPCGRLGEREELANLASYMCSDYASWLSGEIINFDGGNIRQLAGMFDKVRKVPESEWDRIEAKIKGLKSNAKK